MTDQVRWFEQHPACWKCGGFTKLGILRGPRNESYGSYCRKCADKRIKAAEHERAREQSK